MSLDDPKIFVAAADAGPSTRSRCSRRDASDGAAGARRGCRRSGFAIVLLNFVPVSYFVDDEPQRSSSAVDVHLFLLGVSHRTAPGRAARAARLLEPRCRRGASRRWRARRPPPRRSCCRPATASEIYVASDDPARARDDSSTFLSEYHGVPRRAFAPHLFDVTTATPRGTCSAWPPASIRWSSASRRSSAR